MADAALDLVELFAELGFESTAAQTLAREALVAARLTTPTKQGIAESKRPRVEETLRGRFLVTCGTAACARTLGDRQLIVAHTRQRCWICGGSDNRRAVDDAAAVFRRHHVRRIVVVGGSPSVHDELRQLAPSDWELRIIDGTERRTGDAARNDLRWSDLVLIWGSSELDHKVSGHYAGSKELAKHVVLVNRRGIAALLEAAVRHLGGNER